MKVQQAFSHALIVGALAFAADVTDVGLVSLARRWASLWRDDPHQHRPHGFNPASSEAKARADIEAASLQARTEAAAHAQDTLQVRYRFKVGDQVVYTNCFGVCWGIRTIIGLDYRNGPTYFYAGSDSPWFSVAEEHFRKASREDLQHTGDTAYFQDKYGFTPTDYGGCW